MYQEKPDLHTLRGAVIWGNLSDISGSVWDAYWPVPVGISATQKGGSSDTWVVFLLVDKVVF